MSSDILKKSLDGGLHNDQTKRGNSRCEIAEKIGVSEPTFIRWLRKELDEPTKRKALAAIEKIKREHESEPSAED